MKTGIRKYGPYVLLGLIFFMLILLNLIYQDHWLDSDMAAEMIFSKLLAEQGHIFATPDWYYSTEFRFLYTHLVMGPLFRVISDWHVIRTVTNIIFYVLLLASYFYFVKPLKLSGESTMLTASVLLLPFSDVMITHMQMGNTYMTHVIIAFCFMGMFLRLAGKIKYKTVFRWLLPACYIALAFICGVSGVRYLLALQCPLVLTAIIYLLRSEEFQNFRSSLGKENMKQVLSSAAASYLGYSVLGAVFGIAGYAMNVLWVSRHYVFKTYDSVNFIEVGQGAMFSRLQYAIDSLLRFFGYISDRGVLSLRGLITISAFMLLAVFIYCEIKSLKRCVETRYFVAVFLAVAFLLNIFVFVFTSSIIVPRYYITVFIFVLPVLAFYMESERMKFDKLVLTMVLAGCFLLTTGKTVISFIAYDKNEDKRPVAAFLQENGYDFGFATYDNGNIITELTDGAVEIANIGDLQYLGFYKLSSPMKYYDEDYHEGETFVLLTYGELWENINTKAVSIGNEVYNDYQYVVLVYENVEQLMNCAETGQ